MAPICILVCRLDISFFSSQVSPDEMDTLEKIRSFVGDDENKGTSSIAEFPLLTKNAVESLRYRAEVIYYFLYSWLAETK